MPYLTEGVDKKMNIKIANSIKFVTFVVQKWKSSRYKVEEVVYELYTIYI